jgi:hypothetical protein
MFAGGSALATPSATDAGMGSDRCRPAFVEGVSGGVADCRRRRVPGADQRDRRLHGRWEHTRRDLHDLLEAVLERLLAVGDIAEFDEAWAKPKGSHRCPWKIVRW